MPDDDPANDNDALPTLPLIPIREETGLPPPPESGARRCATLLPMIEIGSLVRRIRERGSPWTSGVVVSIGKTELRAHVGVRMLDAPLGIAGTVVFCEPDNLVEAPAEVVVRGLLVRQHAGQFTHDQVLDLVADVPELVAALKSEELRSLR